MLKKLLSLGAMLLLALTTVAQSEPVIDPTGSYQFQLPTGWTVEERDGYILVNAPNDEIINVLSVEETVDMMESVEILWGKYDPDFDFSTILQTQEVPEGQLNGFEEGVVYVYADGTGADGAFVAGGSYIFEGRTYPSLTITTLSALQRRFSQLLVFSQTYRAVTDATEEDEAASALPWNDDMAANLRAYIETALPALEVPGVAVAIVQGGEIVFAEGFGTTGNNNESVDADTLFLTASMTKSMTTLAMAQAVDEGLFDWDTPVIEVFPSFEVADPEITQTITMENLVCACSGVPRRDFEIILNEVTAADIVESLATFEFFTEFGAAFQYSNQLVAAGGFLTAAARGAELDTLLDDYVALMDAGVFAPLGMERTTLRAADLDALGNLALPHGVSLESTDAFDIAGEAWVEAIAPSGGVWSTVNDVARYLLMQLEGGVIEGERIVSEENLARTWEAQVAVDSTVQYGLGWILTEYAGNPIIFHGGNALGYTSEMSFVPSGDFGLVVLTNRGYTQLPALVEARILELIFDQEDETTEALETVTEGLTTGREALAWQYNQTLDITAFEVFEGEWTNAALGDLTIRLEDGSVIADFGEYETRIWEYLTGSTEPDATPEPRIETLYLSVDAPLAGQVLLRFRDGADPVILMGSGATEYTFTKQ